MVASMVDQQCLDEVLKAMCCSLHTRYFSIHVGSISIDDEPMSEARDRRRPLWRGTSGDWVGDDNGSG
jgi:hypothetical protein